MINLHVPLDQPSSPFPHPWERAVGSCHAATALRADWQRQLARCRRELGFEGVRFHGLLCDDLSVLLGTLEQPDYSFHNLDQVLDFIVSLDVRPIIELSFMPTALASGADTLFHYRANVTPPRSYAAWGALIEALTRHLVERYGLDRVRGWPFEVWNEPNLPDFWRGSQAAYFELYRHAALAVKRVDTQLRVGGPATARNAWLRELLEFCRTTHTPLDFASTHYYPTDAAFDLGLDWDELEQMMARADRDTLAHAAAAARESVGDRPLYYTEWSSSPSGRDRFHDEPYAAAFITHTALAISPLVDVYAYWTFTDIFEEHGQASAPFHGGFGLLTLHDIAKPAYRAFELLHRLGERRWPIELKTQPTIGAVAAPLVDRSTGVGVLIYNHAVPHAPIDTETLDVRISGLPIGAWMATVERIDETHANPKAAWLRLGAPVYPSPEQLRIIEAAAVLQREPLSVEVRSEGELHVTLSLPPHAVALISLSMEP